jgi:hypothetical protein
MAGESSWKSEKRFERNSDIFLNQSDFQTNERFRQSESHLANDDNDRLSENYDDVRRAAFATTTTTRLSSRRSSTDSKSQSKESSPRKFPSRSRDSSQSKMLTEYKFQLLNQDRRPSQELTLNSSGKSFEKQVLRTTQSHHGRPERGARGQGVDLSPPPPPFRRWPPKNIIF